MLVCFQRFNQYFSAGLDSAGLDKDDRSARKRSIFLVDGEPVRLETVFSLWFERTGNNKKKETIERYLKGETLSRKDLKGYLKSASSSVEDLDTFVLLFNLLLPDRKLALNGNTIKEHKLSD